jgi:hypothetical protein
VLATVVAAVVLTAPAFRANATPYSDKLCPEASQYVTTLGALSTNDAQKVYDAAHATTTAYETCGKRHLADGNIEPHVHYAYTRQASYEVVEARALLALHRTSDAKAILENSKRLASDVYDWSTIDKTRSIYRPAAKEILDAAVGMLATLNAAPAASGAPAPKPTAAP